MTVSRDGYRRKMHARAYLRAECGGLEPAQVGDWLTQFEPVCVLVVGSLARKNPFAVVEREDLMSVARMAVLEACQTFRPEAGGTLRTWVGNVIRWRVAAAIEEMSETWVVHIARFDDDEHDPLLDPWIDPEPQYEVRRELANYVDRIAHGEVAASVTVFSGVDTVDEAERCLRVLVPPQPPQEVSKPKRQKRVG